MEAAGLTVGIAALAGLCSACVDAFSLVVEAKEFSIDYEILTIKLDMEKTRLLQWAEGVGLLAEDSEDRHASLLAPSILPQIERILLALKVLLSNSENLASRYGLEYDDGTQAASNTGQRLFVSAKRTQSFKAAFAQFQARTCTKQKHLHMAAKAKWVIKDHSRFEKLADQVHGLITSLNELVIIPRTFRRILVKEDVESLGHDLSELRLLQRASEVQPNEWMECSSSRIGASQTATQDFRTIEEWLEDITNSQSPLDFRAEKAPSSDKTRSQRGTGRMANAESACDRTPEVPSLRSDYERSLKTFSGGRTKTSSPIRIHRIPRLHSDSSSTDSDISPYKLLPNRYHGVRMHEERDDIIHVRYCRRDQCRVCSRYYDRQACENCGILLRRDRRHLDGYVCRQHKSC